MGPLVISVTLALLQVGHVLGANNVPQFLNTSALDSRYLSEAFPVGDVVGTITAFDPDGTEVEFYIDGDGGEYFAIDRSSGVVTLKKVLEFDTKASEREIVMTIRIVDQDRQSFTIEGKVFVQDANDIPPAFERYDIFATLNEDDKPGLFVADIIVNDRDRNNDVISVECRGETEDFADACDKFALEYVAADTSNIGWKGKLVLAKPLDYEQRNSYAVLLVAKDGKFEKTNEVHIEVNDINDTPPRWTRVPPITVNEEVSIGVPITMVTAVDGDLTNPRDISYEIMDDDHAEFTINNLTGVISHGTVIDFDDQSHEKGVPHKLIIKAREIISTNPLVIGNNEQTTSTTEVSITVDDINDNPPTFDKPSYTAFISENIVTGGNVQGLQMTITDIDSGTFNSFDLVSLNYQDIFSIIPGKGKANAGATMFIRNSEQIDYERGLKEYVIKLEARENHVTPALTGYATVIIKVRDVNDETPRFSQETYTRNLLETSSPGSVVIDLDAIDDEDGKFGTAGIRYKLFGSNDFVIDENTGVISVAACNLPNIPGSPPCIDYETKQQYVLTISATDNEGSVTGSRTRSVQVIVKIQDENDNIPNPIDHYTGYIYEGETEPVTPIIVKAIDPDTVGGPVFYRLADSTSISNWKIENRKNVNGESIGIISAIRPVLFSDAQDPNNGSVNFQVVSEDQKAEAKSLVTIYIIDINNNAPEFSNPSYEESIPEDTKGGIFVKTVTVTDGDAPTTGNGKVDFFITSGALGKFVIKNARREANEFLADVFTSPDATFNFDLNKKYEMTLTARDQGTPQSKRGEAKLIVNIDDINNNSPRITPTSVSISVREDEQPTVKVHEVIAIDPDNTADLRYYMSATRAQNPNGVIVNVQDFDYTDLFIIEEETGFVRVNKPLNREVTSFLINKLVVVDIAAKPPQTGTGALFITVTEVNDQDPEFDSPFYNLTIDEELNINYLVKNLRCIDEDDQISRYEIIQTKPRNPNFFTLMDNSGGLIISNRIDFEVIEEIELLATCYDDGSPKRSSSTEVFVNVLNINDNSPQFDEPLYTVEITETAPGKDIGGTILTTVRATDKDKGDFGVVRYKMADNNNNFLVDNLSGEITIKPGVTFDRETSASDGFQVIAYDSPNTLDKSRETPVPIYLNIMDLNDNCPLFNEKIYTGSIPENANTGTDIIDVIADDKDAGINRVLAFTVQAGSFDPPEGENYFDIGFKSGRIFTKSTLSSKSGEYRLNVTATDTEGKLTSIMCSSHIPVIVTVSQSQNYAPQWIDPPNRDFVIYVLESQYEGMLVYDSKAIDLDSGPSGVVDYFFVDGNSHVPSTKEFRINRVTGIIRAEIEFDREQVDRYFLTLVAKDQGLTRASSETTLIVVILDVNDNDPVFPMKDGEVEPLVFSKTENDLQSPNDGDFVGQCNATDADPDHDNNRIFYEILSADDKVLDMVKVNRETCEIYLTEKVDYEMMPELKFNIFAFNEKNDDTVRRHRRAVNPSILPVVIEITDINDNPPAFTENEYFACAGIESPYQSLIKDLDAHDVEQDDTELYYSLDSTNTDFTIDQQGIIHNSISFSSTSERVFAFNAHVSDGSQSSSSKVNVFVSSESKQILLVVNRPSSDLRRVQREYEEIVMESSRNIEYACVDIQNHINDDGTISSSKSDIYISALRKNSQTGKYVHIPASTLYSYIRINRRDNRQMYDSFFVSSVSRIEDDGFGLDEDVVLAILIITILLIAFAIILLILACYCIWAKKKKKIKKVKAQRHTIVQSTVDTKQESYENPVYHNSGYVAYEDEYSTVSKSRKDIGPISPVMIPAPTNLQPLSTFAPANLEPAEPEDETPPELPEPFIETEVMPVDEPISSPPAPLMEPEYEDHIETVVADDDIPLPDPPALDDEEIETEIRDDTPPPTPTPFDSD